MVVDDMLYTTLPRFITSWYIMTTRLTQTKSRTW